MDQMFDNTSNMWNDRRRLSGFHWSPRPIFQRYRSWMKPINTHSRAGLNFQQRCCGRRTVTVRAHAQLPEKESGVGGEAVDGVTVLVWSSTVLLILRNEIELVPLIIYYQRMQKSAWASMSVTGCTNVFLRWRFDQVKIDWTVYTPSQLEGCVQACSTHLQVHNS